jgi:rubrerythrin
MSIDFNADEILEMAQQIERNGARFYRLAAQGTDEPDKRELFLDLATMEDEHEGIFATMKRELSATEWESTTFDPHGEGAAYLKAMADGHVFDPQMDPSDLFNELQSTEDILRKAIDLEKDSIIFYVGMIDMVPEKLGRDKVKHIIREEMEHIVTLNRQITARKAS